MTSLILSSIDSVVGKSVTIRVILDSNFLLIPLQFKIDIFEELMKLLNQRVEPILLTPIERELRTMATIGSPKQRKLASRALELAHKCIKVNVRRGKGETNDDVILRVATDLKCPVATNDRRLRRRLRDISVPVIYMRQKSRLELEGSI